MFSFPAPAENHVTTRLKPGWCPSPVHAEGSQRAGDLYDRGAGAAADLLHSKVGQNHCRVGCGMLGHYMCLGLNIEDWLESELRIQVIVKVSMFFSTSS